MAMSKESSQPSSVLIHQGGTFFGTLKTDQADVAGSLQGEVFVKNLISIRSSGSVNGHVRYGQLAMEMGADLSAELRNVPPRLAGDLDITVKRGKSAVITTEDITAIDPDDTPDNLTYTVSNLSNGYVALTGQAGVSIVNFTQADIEAWPRAFRPRWRKQFDREFRRGCRRR